MNVNTRPSATPGTPHRAQNHETCSDRCDLELEGWPEP